MDAILSVRDVSRTSLTRGRVGEAMSGLDLDVAAGFFKVSRPAASPWIVSALEVGVPFSLIGAIIGEFMAASRGLGSMIQLNRDQFDTRGHGILAVCVMLFNGVLNRRERYVLRWRPREKAAAARELQ